LHGADIGGPVMARVVKIAAALMAVATLVVVGVAWGLSRAPEVTAGW
jgi:hypothetical protein